MCRVNALLGGAPALIVLDKNSGLIVSRKGSREMLNRSRVEGVAAGSPPVALRRPSCEPGATAEVKR